VMSESSVPGVEELVDRDSAVDEDEAVEPGMR
jgi:hypothetical protein